MPPKKKRDETTIINAEIVEHAPTTDPERIAKAFVFPDGSQYRGEYIEVDGKMLRDGIGEYKNDSERYIGTWKNDAMHGEGKFFFSSGAKYEGGFVDNMMQGEGTYRWPFLATPPESVGRGSAKYEGQWLANKMHGKGCYTDEQGIEWKGVFHNGTFHNGHSNVVLRK